MHWKKALFRIGLLIGLILLLLQVWNSWQAIAHREVHILYPYQLLMGLALTLIQQFLVIMGWTAIMRALCAPLSVGHAVQSWLLSYLPRYIPGAVWGYWSRSHWLAKAYQIDYAHSVLGSVLEMLLLLLSAMLLTVIYACLNLLRGWILWFSASIAGLIVICTLFLPWIVLLSWGLLSRVPVRIPLLKRAFCFPAVKVKSPRWGTWLAAVIIQYLMWAIYGAAVYYVGRALDVSSMNVWDTTWVVSAAWIPGFLVVLAPAGLGIRESALAFLLSSRFSLLSGQASAVAVLSRFQSVLGELIWLMVGLILYFRQRQCQSVVPPQ